MENKHLNAECSICGTKYHRCDSCAEITQFTPWRSIVDDINCYKIFLIIRDYTNKVNSKEKTKIELQKCDLSKSFLPDIQKVIEEIMTTDKKRTIKKDDNIVEEDI